jgi:hypothetical protein
MKMKKNKIILMVGLLTFISLVSLVSAQTWTFDNGFDGWTSTETYINPASPFPDWESTYSGASGVIILDACSGEYDGIKKTITIPGSPSEIKISIVKMIESPPHDGQLQVLVNGEEIGTEHVVSGYSNPVTYRIPDKFLGKSTVVELRSISNGDCFGEHIGIDIVTISSININIKKPIWTDSGTSNQVTHGFVGEKYDLNAQITNADGKIVTFNIYESDLQGTWLHYVTSINAEINDGKANAPWTAIDYNDGPLEGDPEFVFKATVSGMTSEPSENLWISQPNSQPTSWVTFPSKGSGFPSSSKIDEFVTITAPPSVNPGEEFDVTIVIKPKYYEDRTGRYLGWAMLDQTSIEKFESFANTEGFEINPSESESKTDVINTQDQSLWLIHTGATSVKIGINVLNGRITTDPLPIYKALFIALGYNIPTSGDEVVLHLVDEMNKGQHDLVELTVKEVRSSYLLDPEIDLWDGKYGITERSDSYHIKLHLRAPKKEGTYKVAFTGNYKTMSAYVKPNLGHKVDLRNKLTDGTDASNFVTHYESFSYTDNSITQVAEINVKEKLFGIFAFCPVDISVTDPNGHIINQQFNEITGASYTDPDLDGDNDPDAVILLPNTISGKYHISVTPKPGRSSTETYTLQVSSDGNLKTIANKIAIKDIPTQPYEIEVTSDGKIIVTRGSIPTPEFPSLLLPVTMIIGFLGAVLLIQKTREH